VKPKTTNKSGTKVECDKRVLGAMPPVGSRSKAPGYGGFTPEADIL